MIISEIENKITDDHDHDNYIKTQEFNKLISENFTARLKQANLASQSDTVNFIKKTLKLSKKVKAISTKGSTKDLLNKFNILNAKKYFSSPQH